MFYPQKVVISFALILMSLFTSFAQAPVKLDFMNPTFSVDQRVEMLISQMTIEEKASQLRNNAAAIPRLQIPQYNWWNECLHGVARAGYATVFPQSITVAASFNKNLMYEIGTIISDEARAKHHDFVRKGQRGIYLGLNFWSPNINIFRDPRWGRGHETYGEDPYLTGELAVPFIKGLQGSNPDYYKTIATAKHFAVHSGPEPGRHSFNANASDVDLYETYLPAFRKTVKDAKVGAIMGAYNRFRGVSCSGHDFLLNQVLRKQWGFTGHVVSDCGAIEDIHKNHKLASSPQEAVAIGIKGGCDMECGPYYENIPLAIKENLLSEADVDAALKRIFTARFRLGLLDGDEQGPYSKISMDVVCSDYNNRIARKAAQESIILLKNNNSLLPLAKANLKKIAVVGPNAENWESLLGNYHGMPKNPVTFLQGIKNKVEPATEVIYTEGSHLASGVFNMNVIPSCFLRTENDIQGLTAEYFSNSECKGVPVMTQIDDKIDFSWQGKLINQKLDGKYSVRWSGYIVPPVSGVYEIGRLSKDGMRIVFEGNEICKPRGNGHHMTHESKALTLEAGKKYKIVCEFQGNRIDAMAQLLWAMPDANRLSKAVDAAERADATVVVLGLNQRLEGEAMSVKAEGFKGGDRVSIGLPKEQEDLLKAVKATGKPVILVINAGSAMAINWAAENVDAIVNVGYPGEEGGNALADVLFGDYNPAGRLPVTYYKSVDQLPPFESYDMKGRTYRYFEGEPLYPFGYGLSYTNFGYSDLQLPKSIKAGDDFQVSVLVTNTGKMAGDEVVQLYLSDEKGSTPRPIRQLEGFERITLKAGESKRVTFLITARQLSMINQKTERVIEPGKFTISVGGQQPGFKAGLNASTTTVISASLKINGFLKLNDL
jgi:beta-glucosidase